MTAAHDPGLGPVAVTGANRGIGLAAAKHVAALGHPVVLLCRDAERGREAARTLPPPCGTRPHRVFQADLASLASVRQAAREVTNFARPADPARPASPLAALVNNAAVLPHERAESPDGFELQLAVTHLGHFLLTCLLLDSLRADSRPDRRARVVTVSSGAHYGPAFDFEDPHFRRKPYHPLTAYQQSKLANVLFTKALARRVAGTGVETVALGPGVYDTPLFRDYAKAAPAAGVPLASPVGETAGRIVGELAVGRPNEDLNGAYMSKDVPARPSEHALSEDDQERLWTWSAEAVELASAAPAPAAPVAPVAPAAEQG